SFATLPACLPLDGPWDGWIFFIPDQICDTIFLSENRSLAFLVRMNAHGQIIRHTDVESAVLAAGENINITPPHGAPSRWMAGSSPAMTSYVKTSRPWRPTAAP